MEKIKIGEVDVILEDLGEGCGKVIIASGLYNSSYYWGAMGGSLKEFLNSINSQYFANKFCSNTWELNAKKSVKNVRRHIREELSYELPWYKYMEAQKELRKEIKALENCYDKHDFVHQLSNIHNNVLALGLDRYDKEEFIGVLENTFTCEPWNFIGETVTPEYKWYKNLHKQIKKEI
jgi:hypothetical protein